MQWAEIAPLSSSLDDRTTKRKKDNNNNWTQWPTPIIPALWEAKVGRYLKPGVQDQPDQHGEAPSLLKKIQKVTRCGGEYL